jgi:hypothetical protein
MVGNIWSLKVVSKKIEEEGFLYFIGRMNIGGNIYNADSRENHPRQMLMRHRGYPQKKC